MRINTKFDIGETLWTVIDSGRTVCRFEISIIKVDRDGLYYRSTQARHGYWDFHEKDCYRTLAEAEKSLEK